MTSQNILVGKIVAAHGIRGWVKIKSYTTIPSDICKYSPILKSNGTELKIELKSAGKNDVIIASIKGIVDRNQAEELKGTELFTLSSSITKDKNEILFSELIGFKVLDNNDSEIGEIVDILNFGAGEILEIKLNNKEKTALLSYNKDSILDQNKTKGFIKIDTEHLLED